MHKAFFCKQDEKNLLANGVWQTFGKGWTTLAKFSTVVWQNSAVSGLVKLNGEFFDECCASATFCLAQKVW